MLRQLGLKKGLLRPKYTSELRRYAPFLIAEVTVANAPDMKAALGSGFRQIAGFIFGKNSAAGTKGNKVAMTSPVTLEMDLGKQASEKVAMTSPVSAELLADDTYKVREVPAGGAALERRVRTCWGCEDEIINGLPTAG